MTYKTSAYLEHANLTVSDPEQTAALLCELFNWEVRWAGPALDNGRVIHVGSKNNGESYVALYTHDQTLNSHLRDHKIPINLNHLGIVVNDLDEIEARVVAIGLIPNSHADYQPGRRFYFDMNDSLEIEVISYKEKTN